MNKRIFLSPPHMGGEELDLIRDAFASNYIAPVGPHIDAFEQEFAQIVGAQHAAAVNSGTAALHLVLRYVDVQPEDEVICSTLTFVASANAILYLGGKPIFIDSDYKTWNMDPELLAVFLKKRARKNQIPKALVLVHLYGQSADIDPIKELCDRYDIALIEDAAEALGATYKGKAPGIFGQAGIFSFNGNKIISTSGGGMVVSDDDMLTTKIKYWASQARDPGIHYEHSELGYNYRMSNVLAAIGRGQLRVLGKRVQKKQNIFRQYYNALADLPGIKFMPESNFASSTHWLTCLTIDPSKAEIDRDMVIRVLEKNNIESRPTWKPMHLQPLYQDNEIIGGNVAETIFNYGLCLPSGTSMSDSDLSHIINLIRGCWD